MVKKKEKQYHWQTLANQKGWKKRTKDIPELKQLAVLEVPGDGNCFFHSVARALQYGNIPKPNEDETSWDFQDIRHMVGDTLLKLARSKDKSKQDKVELFLTAYLAEQNDPRDAYQFASDDSEEEKEEEEESEKIPSRWNPSQVRAESVHPKTGKLDIVTLASKLATVVETSGFCYQGDELVLSLLTQDNSFFLKKKLGILVLTEMHRGRTTTDVRINCIPYVVTDKTERFLLLLQRRGGAGDHWKAAGIKSDPEEKKDFKVQTVIERSQLPQVLVEMVLADCKDDSNMYHFFFPIVKKEQQPNPKPRKPTAWTRKYGPRGRRPSPPRSPPSESVLSKENVEVIDLTESCDRILRLEERSEKGKLVFAIVDDRTSSPKSKTKTKTTKTKAKKK